MDEKLEWVNLDLNEQGDVVCGLSQLCNSTEMGKPSLFNGE